jgi:hypothetical protein
MDNANMSIFNVKFRRYTVLVVTPYEKKIKKFHVYKKRAAKINLNFSQNYKVDGWTLP